MFSKKKILNCIQLLESLLLKDEEYKKNYMKYK
jgi:hypothetical protein